MARRRRGRAPFAPAPGAGANGDGDDEDEDDDGGGRFDDLLQEDGFADRRGAVRLTSDQVPTEVDGLPIPPPYQGLQRAALVFNFNFVWDDDAEEWVRQGPFDGGGGGAITIEGVVETTAAGGGTFTVVETGLTDPDADGKVLECSVGPAGTAQNAGYFMAPGAEGNSSSIDYRLEWDDFNGEYLITIVNNLPDDEVVRAVLYSVDPSGAPTMSIR